MIRINAQEQLIRLLSAKLKAQGSIGLKQPNTGQTLRPLRRATALIEAQGFSDQEASHLLLAGILADHFGPRVASDPQFKSVIAKVYEQIQNDKDAHELLLATVEGLRSFKDP